MTENRHQYIELGSDLLAKPNALCDLIEAEGFKPTVVFCNLPSDTDLVKVILKKRNISSRKLIGNIPPDVVKEATDELASGAVQALIATDIGAQHIDMRKVGLVINYSIPGDQSSYQQRAGEEGTATKVVSLVTPLDFTNFHTLKKCLDHDVLKIDAPTPAVVSGGRFQMLVNQVAGFQPADDVKAMVEQIAAHERRDQIIAFLLTKNLEGHQGRRDRDAEPRGDHRRGGNRPMPGDQRGRRSRTQMVEVGEEMGADSSMRDDGDRTPLPPVKKDVRYYLGHGGESGLSESAFRELLQKTAPDAAQGIQRFRMRGRYAFVDFSEASAELFETAKDTIVLSGGEKLFAKKTVIIPEPRPPLFNTRRGRNDSRDEGSEQNDNGGDYRAESDSAREEASFDNEPLANDVDEVNFNR